MCPKKEEGKRKKKGKKIVKKNSKSNSRNVKVYEVLSRCFKKTVTSPRMLTKMFINELLTEMKAIAFEEKSQFKIGVINQIAFDLSNVAPMMLNLSFAESDSAHPESSYASEEMRQTISSLKKLDDSIYSLMGEKLSIYERAYNTARPRHSHIATSSQATNEAMQLGGIEEEITQPHDLEASCTQMEPQYFDISVVSAAALSARLSSSVKDEPDEMSDTCPHLLINRFSQYSISHMKIYGSYLVCATKNGKIVRFDFGESLLPHLPRRTCEFDLCEGPVADLVLWNNSLIIAPISGVITKCTMRGKIVKKFSLKQTVTAMTEIQGLLYAASKIGYLHTINLRSLTRLKEPIELNQVVIMLRCANYNGSMVLVSLTESGEIIGKGVVDGTIGSSLFKFSLPGATVFDINVSLNQSITIFCGSPSSTSCLFLENGAFSHKDLFSNGASSILIHKNHILMGSSFGDLVIINIETKKKFAYNNIVVGKIVSIACLTHRIFVSTDTPSLYCLCIDDTDDLGFL